MAEIESLAYSGDFESAGHVAQAVTTRNTKPSLEIQPHLGKDGDAQYVIVQYIQ